MKIRRDFFYPYLILIVVWVKIRRALQGENRALQFFKPPPKGRNSKNLFFLNKGEGFYLSQSNIRESTHFHVINSIWTQFKIPLVLEIVKKEYWRLTQKKIDYFYWCHFSVISLKSGLRFKNDKSYKVRIS